MLQTELVSTTEELAKASSEAEKLRVQLSAAEATSRSLRADLARVSEEAGIVERRLANEVRICKICHELCISGGCDTPACGSHFVDSAKSVCLELSAALLASLTARMVEFVCWAQMSAGKVARADNASLRNELSGLRSQLTAASKQIEAEKVTSALQPPWRRP